MMSSPYTVFGHAIFRNVLVRRCRAHRDVQFMVCVCVGCRVLCLCAYAAKRMKVTEEKKHIEPFRVCVYSFRSPCMEYGKQQNIMYILWVDGSQ